MACNFLAVAGFYVVAIILAYGILGLFSSSREAARRRLESRRDAGATKSAGELIAFQF
jgi:hypothetical protein